MTGGYVIEKDIMLQSMLRTQLKESDHNGHTHLGLYTPNYVFNLVEGGDPDISCTLRGHKVRLFSHRYLVFKRSLVCVGCGLVGTVMGLDTQHKKDKSTQNQPHPRAHFNLYGIRSGGGVVLFTKDHIIPKSKGGKCELSNYQTMCATCNFKKGSK